MAAVDSIITSVSPQQAHHVLASPELLQTVTLDCRGQRFHVDRETLMNLPESVLLCLFPNGLVLSRVSGGGGGGQWSDGSGDGDDDEYLYVVDFDADCFTFVVDYFHRSRDEFYGTSDAPGPYKAQSMLVDPGNTTSPNEYTGSRNPLLTKQAIIVLREELEYFAIPSSSTSTAPVNGEPNTTSSVSMQDTAANLEMKRACGSKLLEKQSIFTALQRNVNKENNVAEQHLIDMLCMSGFDREDTWGFRAMEPSRSCISSIALVHLKTGIAHQGGEVMVDAQQMGTAQKLLLFWRKPARKCWWDGVEVDIAPAGSSEPRVVKLWARRVWTLELSLI